MTEQLNARAAFISLAALGLVVVHWVFVAVHGLPQVVASGGYSGVLGLLIAVASLVVEHGL